jgi:alpha-L-fucosidase
LMDLYQKAGAKYFFSMGVHHDNYDLWNSKYQPRWNSVATGPRKDIVGMWAAAARKRGMRFGVSEHLSNSFAWMAASHRADTKGPLAGVPYDGNNPAFADLYFDISGMPKDFAATIPAMTRPDVPAWKEMYFKRVKDLVDQHQPDMLYTDGHIQYEEFGLGTVAEIYNRAGVTNSGHTEGVYFSKGESDCTVGTCVLDRERGVADEIWPVPWQTDTCIGNWHYRDSKKYKSPKKVIDLLVDIVSKNGNLLLNFPLPASGELDSDEMRILQGITDWMAVNGEGIFATRPWTINGEGPGMKIVPNEKGQNFNEDKKADLGAKDLRFTTKGKILYAFVQGWPSGELAIQALGTASAQKPGKVVDVRLLGRDEPLKFVQAADGLRVTMAGQKPATADLGIAMRVTFA